MYKLTMNDQQFLSRPSCSPRFIQFSLILLAGSLTACQSLKPPALPTMPVSALPVESATADGATQNPAIRFSISGKIGVRTTKQSGSAFYAWVQDGERFAIDLTGALGIGQTHIEGVPGQVTLNSAKTGLLTATTPEALLQQATGWQAPISYLPHWIEGQAIDQSSPSTRDANQRLLTLTEGGWNVSFEYEPATSPEPSRLVMLQDTDASAKNRVILTVFHEAAQ